MTRWWAGKMIKGDGEARTAAPPAGQPPYARVIVLTCMLMMAITYGLMYSYGVFFKPLAEYFAWDRESVSAVYSVFLLIRGAISIGTGWLADRYGARRLMVFCGLMIGLGLVLSSRVTALWQFYLTYAVIEAVGMSGTFGVVTAVTSRWFVKNRGLALGIVSSGTGLGVLMIVPGSERLIAGLGWSQAFLIAGLVCGVIMTAAAFLLRPAPPEVSPAGGTENNSGKPSAAPDRNAPREDATIRTAVKNPRMLLLLAAFALFFFSAQTITVHLVNYATDAGISSIAAASFISIIGLASIAGRLTMGLGADRIGIHNTLVLTCALLAASLIGLIFTESLWAFYLFAAVFGFAYGGEIPQIPMFIGRFFGTRSMATLVGLTLFVTNIGGALGPWVTGKLFDMTQGYQWAFVVTAAAGIGTLLIALLLKHYDSAEKGAGLTIDNRLRLR